MMCTQYCVLLVLLYLCNGSNGSDIFLRIYRNKTVNLYHESQTIEFSYLHDEAVELTCSISGNTVKNGIYPTLTWIEGDKEWAPANNEISITTTKILRKEDDGTELKCRAKSAVLDKEWTISAYFEKKKSPQEILKAQSSLFTLLLIGIGGVIGGTIVLLLLYRIFLCCRKRRTDRVDNEKVIYSAKHTKTQEKQLTEIGFDNIACHLKENDTYVSFDSPESEQDFDNDKTLRIQNDSSETKVTENDDQRDVSLWNTVDDSNC